MDKVELSWKEGMEFKAQSEGGIEVSIDGQKEQGPNPPEIFLMGLSSCASIHLTMILEKMRVEIDDLEVVVNGQRREESPRYFANIKLEFIIYGEELPEDKLENALKLAAKNCGMWQSIRPDTEISYSYEVK